MGVSVALGVAVAGIAVLAGTGRGTNIDRPAIRLFGLSIQLPTCKSAVRMFSLRAMADRLSPRWTTYRNCQVVFGTQAVVTVVGAPCTCAGVGVGVSALGATSSGGGIVILRSRSCTGAF